MVICWSLSLLKIVPYHLYSIPFRLMMVTNASVIKATSATASNSSHMLLAMLTALHMAKTLCTSNTTRTKAALIIFTNNISLCYTSMSLKFTLNKKNLIFFILQMLKNITTQTKYAPFVCKKHGQYLFSCS